MSENPVGTTIAAAPAVRRSNEPTEMRYARQTRNATVFIAVCVAVFTVLALVGVIIAGVQISKVNSQLSQLNGGVTSSNCVSQGGTDPSC